MQSAIAVGSYRQIATSHQRISIIKQIATDIVHIILRQRPAYIFVALDQHRLTKPGISSYSVFFTARPKVTFYIVVYSITRIKRKRTELPFFYLFDLKTFGKSVR